MDVGSGVAKTVGRKNLKTTPKREGNRTPAGRRKIHLLDSYVRKRAGARPVQRWDRYRGSEKTQLRRGWNKRGEKGGEERQRR